MRLSSSFLAVFLATTAVPLAGPARADDPAPARWKKDLGQREPYDQKPGRITRPATEADRQWRRGRAAPELRVTRQRPVARDPVPPRYDRNGRRLDRPGVPDAPDVYGRYRRNYPQPRPTITPTGPTVRTDAATRINQYPPR